MSSQYDYLNELASYNEGSSEENQLLGFENMKNMSEQMLKDNLIETLGLPASEFILDKSARGLASQIRSRIPALKNSEFLDDVEENGIQDAVANKLAGLKKTVENKIGDINDRVNDAIDDVKASVEGVKSKIQIPDETINAFKDKFDGQNFSPDKINEMMENAKDPDTWHNTLQQSNPEYNQVEAEDARNFVNQQSEKFDYPTLTAQRDQEFMNQNRETLQMKNQAELDNTDLEQGAAKNLSGADNAGIGDGESIPLKAIGENVGEAVGEDVGEGVGELGAEEGIGAALDSTGVLAPIGLLVGLGGLIGSLFGIFDHHSSHAPPPPLIGRPSLDVGV
jgi:hypothetical protein